MAVEQVAKPVIAEPVWGDAVARVLINPPPVGHSTPQKRRAPHPPQHRPLEAVQRFHPEQARQASLHVAALSQALKATSKLSAQYPEPGALEHLHRRLDDAAQHPLHVSNAATRQRAR